MFLKGRKHVLYLVLICTISINVIGQTSFYINEEYVDVENYKSGICSAMVDVNGDGWDDLIRVSTRDVVEVNLASQNNKKLHKIEYEVSLPDNPWSISVGDLDNDGTNEIGLATILRGGFLFSYDPQNQKLKLDHITGKDVYSQGCNFADINNDGMLDWFINDDEALSDIYLNEGDGVFAEQDSYIDLKTNQPSDNSGNYSTDWVDFDGDGDLDFYVSKCSAGADDPTDPRRINQLFVNQGDNTYIEDAAAYGLDFGTQSWATNFGDLDNDGDLDLLIINHVDKWNLLENMGDGSYQNRDASIDSISGFANQCLLRDFDNNGYLDVLVAGANDYLWYNMGNWDFVQDLKPFPYFSAKNFTVGDINHDGFLDTYAAFSEGFNDPGHINDALYLNAGNENNWFALRLIGKASNRNGIGATIKVYSESLGWQTRNVRSGEGYGIMNSLNSHFGIATADRVDSLIIHWPSGATDRYIDLKANQYYDATEGICLTGERQINVLQDGLICPESTLELTGPTFGKYVWSTGAESKSISINEAGIYSLSGEDARGCINPLPAVFFKDLETEDYGDILQFDSMIYCPGTQLELQSPSAASYAWSTGEETQSIDIIDGSQYALTIVDHCGNIHTDEIEINFAQNAPFSIETDTIDKGDVAHVSAQGNNLSWYLSETEEKAAFVGDTLTLENLEINTTVYVQGESIDTFPSEEIGETTWRGTNMYSGASLNGGIYFHVFETIELQSVEVTTDTIGTRKIKILDENQNLVYEKSFTLGVGKNILQLEAVLEPGIDYFMTTDKEQNLQTLGFGGPRLVRSNAGTNYPYNSSDALWITNSSFGPRYFLYFYDWKFKRQDLHCVSERIPVTVLVDFDSSTDEEGEELFSIYPNPTQDVVYIDAKTNEKIVQANIFNILGESLIRMDNISERSLSISIEDLVGGSYYIELITSSEKRVVSKLLKL